MNKFVLGTALAVLFLCAAPVRALGPHECAIIVNANSEDSKALANFYADLRRIPPQNIIHLDLPGRVREARATISPEDFRSLIYEPVMTALKERQLSSHVLAWLYSLDFPTTVSAEPPLSLTGMTFVRGSPPESVEVRQGLWPSQLFRGPDRADGPVAKTVSLEQFTLALTTNMPLPSMMLGWSGSRGMTLDEIKQQLKTAASSDASRPTASVYFEVNDNVRSTTRQWQFETAKKELGELEVLGIASGDMPKDRRDLMGILAGRSDFEAKNYGMLRPGAYADQLTSYGAIFHIPEQTKLIEWLQHGAAASAGTIVEPGSLTEPVALWAKFPTARLFAHYAGGATLIESLYQSIRSPLQILLVGDALCAPWARPPAITLVSMEDNDRLSGTAEFVTSAWGNLNLRSMMIMYILDGKPILLPGQRGGVLKLDTKPVTDGYHSLRAIAYDVGNPVRHQGVSDIDFMLCNRDRFVALNGPEPNSRVDAKRPFTLTMTATGTPERAAIVVQERLLMTAAFSNGMTFVINPQTIGPGPVDVQAIAVYPDREAVRSKPLRLNLGVVNEPPRIIDIKAREPDANGMILLRSLVEDPDGDEVSQTWHYAPVIDEEVAVAGSPDKAKQFAPDEDTLRMAAAVQSVSATFALEQPNRLRAIDVTCRWEESGLPFDRHQGGIVFNAMDENNYLYWGLDGRLSAWALKRVVDGREENVLTRGAPVRMEETYRLRIAFKGGKTMQFIVNDRVEAEADIDFGPGRVGVRAGTSPVNFSDLYVSPPSAAKSFFNEEGDVIFFPAAEESTAKKLHVIARDLHSSTSKAY